jgi:hypothetical protein
MYIVATIAPFSMYSSATDQVAQLVKAFTCVVYVRITSQVVGAYIACYCCHHVRRITTEVREACLSSCMHYCARRDNGPSVG